MNIRKKIMSLVLASTMIMGLAACANKNEEIPYTFEELLTEFSDETNLDELMSQDSKIEIKEPTKENPDQTESVNFLDSVNELEQRMNFSLLLEDADIELSENASEELIKQYSQISIDEAKILLESLSKDDLSPVERERIKAGLSYLATNNKDWIINNGLKISEELLKRVIKGAACEVSGLEVEYYDSCSISSQSSSEPLKARISVEDPISGVTLYYEMTKNIDNNAILAATNALYNCQGLESPSYKEIFGSCEEALEASKIALAAGVELDDEKITSKLKPNAAKEKILEKVATPTTETSQEG